ncbi:GHKL domain-containing protein [Marinilabiliaceae bacterium JC017]|nr:GHKL domain-containing protein [Marinilabiliaceae bacterium JC017]
MITTSQKHKIQSILPHLIGWLIIGIFPLFLFEQQSERSFDWTIRFYYQLLFMAVTFYVNYLVLVPYLLFREKKAWYFVLAFLLSIVVIVLSHYLRDLIYQNVEPFKGAFDFPKEHMPRREGMRPTFWRTPVFFNAYWGILLIVGFSTGIRITQHWAQTKYKQKELEKAHVDSELAFLKNQVSPHFFFNTLNNIYALIKVDGDKAQSAVERLSNMMRYLIYESEDKGIALQKEVAFMQHYIELMKMRISKKVELQVEMPTHCPEVKIPPLLFISFIENAFKHGISYKEKSFISISLSIADPFIVFTCQNSIPQRRKEDKDGASGIGLANIKKRLNLLFGDKATLEITEEEKIFNVSLKIPYQQGDANLF